MIKQIPDSQIAVNIYSIRDFCQSESDLDRSLARLREIGYRAVQISATCVAPAVIRRLLDRNEMFCCATHENLDMIKDTARFLDRMSILDCDYSALGCPPRELLSDERIGELASILNTQGAIYREHGIRLGYHNHRAEFIHGADGTPFLEKLLRAVPPENLQTELDLCWVTRGGASPVAWIEHVRGRMDVVHFKDMTVTGANCDPVLCEVGEGNLDWAGIIDACRRTGVRWYIVEQDVPFGSRDIFESMKISFDNLKKYGVN